MEAMGQRALNGNRELRRRKQAQLRYRRIRVLNRFLGACLLLNLLLLLGMFLRVRNMSSLLDTALDGIQLEESADEAWESLDTYQADAQSRTVTGGVVSRSIAANSYAELWGLERVDKPVTRTKEQVLERLSELGEDSDVIAEIVQSNNLYPEKMLEALANNPEMAGFVRGYADAQKQAAGGLTESEKSLDFPLFLQWDPRWGYEEYGDESCIGLAGCGPTCVSMVLYYLTRDESLTPDLIAEYSMKNGYYLTGTGTRWTLMEDVPRKYGLEVVQPGVDEETAKSVLDEGGVLICSMAPGDFTAAGHFIVLYGYDEEGFLVNDPNCAARSRQHWSWNVLEGQIKNMWAYSVTL